MAVAARGLTPGPRGNGGRRRAAEAIAVGGRPILPPEPPGDGYRLETVRRRSITRTGPRRARRCRAARSPEPGTAARDGAAPLGHPNRAPPRETVPRRSVTRTGPAA